jgi:hypothetical protein
MTFVESTIPVSGNHDFLPSGVINNVENEVALVP